MKLATLLSSMEEFEMEADRQDAAAPAEYGTARGYLTHAAFPCGREVPSASARRPTLAAKKLLGRTT